MEKRKLGDCPIELSRVGLGTFAMAGEGLRNSWGPQDDAVSAATISKAVDCGINWIDTAPIYGAGHAEEVIGNALKDGTNRPLVATKCGRIPTKEGVAIDQLNPDSIRRELEASLRNLQAERIDLYQIHWPRPAAEFESAWRVLGELIEEGLVRYTGVCNFSVDQISAVGQMRRVTSLQTPYSMLRRDFEGPLEEYCLKHNIGVVVFGVLGKGLLTGKITRERVAALPPTDHRTLDRDFQEPRISVHLELVEKLRPIAESRGLTLGQLAVAWVLRNPAVTSAIVGARRPEQIPENAAAAAFGPGEADMAAIEALLEQHGRALARLSG